MYGAGPGLACTDYVEMASAATGGVDITLQK
jgi:hypothetical protein